VTVALEELQAAGLTVSSRITTTGNYGLVEAGYPEEKWKKSEGGKRIRELADLIHHHDHRYYVLETRRSRTRLR